ncbi:MAG TPA: hypothetical protein PK869_15255, partial [Candidatus Hydrogenedentes bacterium]|nr:hypothetical protein [Candidatus Hydrogenedentota bacterium]
ATCSASLAAAMVSSSQVLKKELELRRNKKGTLHSAGKYSDGSIKWFHTSYNGRIRFQKAAGKIVVATVISKSLNDEWQILQSFVGFIYRHFKQYVSSMSLHFSDEVDEE